MVLKDKETWMNENFGRWVKDNEIIIEDLPEEDILNISGKMSGKGYHLEYWKSPKQESGHLHIKEIVFPKDVKLTNTQVREYKKKIMERYINPSLWGKVDWNFVKCKRHRIAEENKEHFKGYGIKTLVKEWNKGYINNCERDIFESCLKLKNGSRDETPVRTEGLNLRTFEDFKHLKKNKNYIVENFLMGSSVNMIHSPPANFKSLLYLYLGISISTGREFLGFKTKKCPVLYLDGENSDEILKERLINVHKGLKLRRNKFPFYILKGGELLTQDKKVHLGFMMSLENEIEEKGIKVLIFDTLHRFCFYDENKSDDINLLYTKVFQPLVQKYGISIIFLHHSRKDGGYRGSGDFLGSVDVSYRISRKGKSNQFIIINEKSRTGEIDNIEGEIEFEKDCIRFYKRKFEEESESKVGKLKETTERIHSLLEIGSEMKRKDIIDVLDLQKFDYGDIKTITRSLTFLCNTGKFDKSDKRGFYRKLR